MKLKLAIFDMDGTVFESNLDWLAIRQRLDITKGASILSEIYRDGGVDAKRLKILEDYERENTLEARPIDGVEGFLEFLETQQIPRALVTNNNRENTQFLLNRYGFRFDLVLTRETKLWKPGPGAFFYTLDQYGCKGEEAVSIGDSHYDVKASRSAGLARTYIIRNQRTNMELLRGLEGSDLSYFNDYTHLQELLESDFGRDVDMSTSRH